MNKKGILLVTISLTLNAQPIFSEGSFEPAECRQPNSDNITLTIKNNREINLPINQKNCDSSYTYIISKNGAITILAGPGASELGLNAQNDIYVLTDNEPHAKYIGSIPVTANPTSENQFKDVTQSGGSIFQATYNITNTSIKLAPESLELIFSGTQCILKRKDSKQCKKLSGTFEKPVCIININGKKILQEKSHCTELEKEIKQ